MKKIFVLGIMMCLTLGLSAQSFFDTNTIQEIRIYFGQPNWDYQMDTAKWGADGYIMADSIKINGALLLQAGIKYKGNSSYDSTYVKNPLNIALDEYLNQDYQGVKTIKLSNQYLDPSMIREVLAYSILGEYMEVPKANFASVYINDQWLGLYTNTETIDKAFCSEHFEFSKGTFIKCNPVLNPSPSTKSNLKYIDEDSTSYFNYYELKSNTGWNELVSLCDSILNHPEALPQMMDMDRLIWMLAFDNAMVNLDSYMGVFAQNYYLYKDGTQRFNPIVWDLNMCFGGFPYIGGGGTSMGALTIADMQNLTGNAHATDGYWPLIKWIQSHPTYKKMYWAHLKTMVEEMIQSGLYVTWANQFQVLIDDQVAGDPYLFFDYTAFQNGLSTNANSGTYQIPGIQSLMDARANYLATTTEWNYSVPDIQPVTPVAVEVGDTMQMQVVVGNANEVYMGCRFYSGQAFVRYAMWDDGLHGDGNAGDGIFGIELPMASGQMQYYFYAQNSNAGMFSPQRAEHEFYTLNAVFQSAAYPVINECFANNASGVQNNFGDYADWIEIKNNSDVVVSLAGLYLSDDANQLLKYAFAESQFVPAHGRRMVWADDRYEAGVPHCNFGLNSMADTLYLSDANGVVLDMVTLQNIPIDTSWARCPDGTGDWTFTFATFQSTNCEVVQVEEKLNSSTLILFPNPSQGRVIFEGNIRGEFQLLDLSGRVVKKGNLAASRMEWDWHELDEGYYLFQCNGLSQKLMILNQ
mgnify:FL=1